MRFTFVSTLMLVLVTLAQAKTEKKKAPSPPPGPHFAATAALDLAGHHEFPAGEHPNDDAASQLEGLCSLADFQALPANDRYVYSFESWPDENNALKLKSFCFNFHLGSEALPSLKVDFAPEGGGPGGVRGFVRAMDPATKSYALRGFGDLDWGGNSAHRFWFNRPVRAFGVVLKSSGDVDLRRFFWRGNNNNGFPVSYLLSDGTVVNLGERELRGALLKADTEHFLGIIDHSGRGIVAVTYTLKGLGGNKAQPISMHNIAFVTMPQPAEAAAINLRSRSDFFDVQTIAQRPESPAPELASVDDFRFIVGTHRYVYNFDTWPAGTTVSGPKATFAMDLDGKGQQGQAVTVTAGNTAGTATLSKATLKDSEALAYHALACEGVSDGQDGGKVTLSFTKPVWSAGVTFRSGRALDLRGSATAPAITYTLSDGSTVNVAAPGASAGHIQPDQRTFVGVIDKSGKGVKSITFRVAAAPGDKTPLYIDDIAFAIAGPPPGDWKMTLNDNFDGDKLNSDIWSTGYKFVDVINNELQGYVPENVTVGNGVCTIKVEHRDCRNTDRFGHEGQAQHFASGAFTSVDKWTQTYGYFEARIKMPKARGAGVWPAFWLLPDRGKDVAPKYRYNYMTKDHGRGMEIDIFEFMPRWKQLDGRFPLHVGCIWSYGPVTEKDPAPHGYGGYAKDNNGWGPKELTFPNLDGEFHTYGLYWSKDRLIYYVDSKPIFRVRDAKHVPNVPFYFLFNVAVHQNGWGKSPDKSNPTMKDIIADMPNAMEIDYFRAYSGTLREDVPDRTTSTTQPTQDTQAPAAAAADTVHDTAPAAPANVGISTPSN